MLYHKDIKLPEGIEVLKGQYKAIVTSHAQQSALNDRLGVFCYPEVITVDLDSIIEIEITEGNQIAKIVIRQSYNENCDLCMAIIPKVNNQAVIKTGWLNSKNDSHNTLDKSKYTQ